MRVRHCVRMRHPDRFGHGPSHRYQAGPTTLPSYSSFEDVCRRMRERRARRFWWRADGNSYNVLGHLMVVIPVLLACFAVIGLGIRFAALDVALLVLACGAIAWYHRDVWRLR